MSVKPQKVCVLTPYTKVTGDHLYLHTNGSWIPVENTYTPCEYTENVMCLVTSKNTIHSGEFTFKDYEETSSNKIHNDIAKVVLQDLNKNNKKASNETCIQFETGEKHNCVPKGTLIKMQNGNYEHIENIKIGSIISTGKVLGNYRCLTQKCDWILVNGVYVSPRIICYHEPTLQWVKAYTIGTLVNGGDDTIENGYHLITETSCIELCNGLLIRDFVETTNVKAQENINHVVSQSI